MARAKRAQLHADDREGTPVLSDVLEKRRREKTALRRVKRQRALARSKSALLAYRASCKRAKAEEYDASRRRAAVAERRARKASDSNPNAPQPPATQSPVAPEDVRKPAEEGADEVAHSAEAAEQVLDSAAVHSEMEDDGATPVVRHGSYVSAAAADKPARARIEFPGLPESSKREASAEAELRTMKVQLTALRAELEQLRGFVKPERASTRAHERAASPATVRVTPKDVTLDKFAGNKDASARVIADDQFLPLLEWLQACEFTLVTSRLPTDLHVPVLVSHLIGAAKRAFLRRWGSMDTSAMQDWSLSDAKLAIAGLVPNHKVHFTKTALAMQFTAGTLEDDLQRFSLYMRNGDLEVDNSHYVFEVLQEKMHRAVHDIFNLAQGLYGKTLQFKPTFVEIMHDAIDIVSTLQVNGKLNGSKRGRSDEDDRSGADKRKRVQKTGAQDHRHKSGANGNKRREFAELAKRFQRCFGCGRHVKPQDLGTHKAECKKDPKAFAQRMGQVKRLVDAGKEKEVNSFPPPKKQADAA